MWPGRKYSYSGQTTCACWKAIVYSPTSVVCLMDLNLFRACLIWGLIIVYWHWNDTPRYGFLPDLQPDLPQSFSSKDLRGRGVLPQLERLMLTLSHGRYLVLSGSVRLVGALALSTTICERNLSTGTGAPGSLRSTSLTSRMVCPPADGYVWHRIKFSLVYSMLIHIACILLMDLVCSLRTLETIVRSRGAALAVYFGYGKLQFVAWIALDELRELSPVMRREAISRARAWDGTMAGQPICPLMLFLNFLRISLI